MKTFVKSFKFFFVNSSLSTPRPVPTKLKHIFNYTVYRIKFVTVNKVPKIDKIIYQSLQSVHCHGSTWMSHHYALLYCLIILTKHKLASLVSM